MMQTPDLIRLLAAGGDPVHPLRPPHLRAVGWLALAATILALLAIHHGLRSDLDAQLGRAAFVVSILASLVTAVLAAAAAFMVSVPGRSRRWMWLPVPALVLWLSTVAYGCLTEWISIGPQGITAGDTARCFATMTLASVPLSLSCPVMLRLSVLFQPVLTAMLRSLAVAAISASALSLLHRLDATALILIWNVGAGAAIVAAGAAFGRSLQVRAIPKLQSVSAR